MDREFHYRVAQLQEALARDEAVGLQDIRVVVSGGRIHLMGEVPTQARRAAIDAVVQRVLPGALVRNDVRVQTIDALGAAAAPEPIE
jgi:osmotically-inducible protein OsmY